ncbi:IS982 family transposase [Methylophaga nitratireducenticrescens]|uniref:Transposase, IS982 family n=1 Tax=Methylophaga nitratireducenticrescens TaxID=754476 RepID=I1XJG2_METNJ|nr:IS982 family transposase [Methylophaga nitratireducenticrescens]AFI83847.1 IS982 family transposase [Methylophaga nitratireducenticrescens]AFI84531.1 IS982 family transposase [Methylophaga nitratireducenticrescens]AFI84559.1 IS982 family transposase [Methylophaga nitratireducenticrescens]AFI84691.1 IS982 family transposase [Methylophaga nitratireducenticrescens]AFI85322.1 IS982 family transposase [Methylophaga nitratireducenticrescens]
MYNLEKMYCEVDDFCQRFIPAWQHQQIAAGDKCRNKPGKLSESEVITILILFHQLRFRDFKTFYTHYARKHLKQAFPQLVSYTRMLKLLQSVLVPLCAFMTQRYGKPTGIAFVDSTKLAVCHNIRIPRNRVFSGVAERGKGTMGWFYGFKLHLLVNEQGEILSVKITTANIDDRKPIPDMVKQLWGTLYGDKGYLSQTLKESLAEQGIKLVTGIRKNMKPQLMTLWDRLMLRKRYVIETIFDQLKNISQIEHSRHRSPVSFMVHLMAGLVAYTFQPKKPSIKLNRNEKGALMQI